MAQNFVLSIGLNDQDKHRQLFNDGYYIKTIGNFIPDCTIIPCFGFYKGELEKSLKVEVYCTTLEKMQFLADKFKTIFNQKEIVITELIGKSVFV